MYQVIELYGDFEPWWFLEDWQESIVAEQVFEHFDEALSYFDGRWKELKASFPYFQSRSDLLAVFWNTEQTRWCEDCGESLQQYTSLLLLKDGKKISTNNHQLQYEQENANTRSLSNCIILTNEEKD